MPDHVTQKVLDTLIERWSIDDDWLVRDDNGFSWWGCPLGQRINVEGPHEIAGLPTYHLTFDVPIFDVADVEPSKVTSLLPLLNRAWNVGAFLVEDNVLKLCGRTYFMEPTAPFRTDQMATVAITAYEYALASMTELVKNSAELGIGAAKGILDNDHPTQGPRRDMDEMLDVIDGAIRPSGELAVPTQRQVDFEMAYQALLTKDRWMPEQIEGGVQGTHIGREGTIMETAVFRYQMIEHPLLGHGYLTTFTVQGETYEHEDDALAASNRRCAAWNALEWQHTDDPPLIALGAWTNNIGGPDYNPLRADVTYALFEPKIVGAAESAFIAVTGAFARVQLLDGPRQVMQA